MNPPLSSSTNSQNPQSHKLLPPLKHNHQPHAHPRVDIPIPFNSHSPILQTNSHSLTTISYPLPCISIQEDFPINYNVAIFRKNQGFGIQIIPYFTDLSDKKLHTTITLAMHQMHGSSETTAAAVSPPAQTKRRRKSYVYGYGGNRVWSFHIHVNGMPTISFFVCKYRFHQP